MNDELYQVIISHLCAGFVMIDGYIIHCVPIFIKKIEYWKTIAKWICE